MRFIRVALLAVSLVSPLAVSATTLLDGGFEAKGAALPVTNYCYDFGATAGGPACVASPWVGGGVILSGSSAWGGVPAASGSYFGLIQTTNSIAQSFVATGNGTATVNWLDTNRNGLGLQNYNVFIVNGMTSQLIGNYSTAVGGWVARTSSSFNLVNGQSYTLRFTGTMVADSTAFIDDVALAVVPSNVPEPAAWVMLIAGFGLVGAMARRRRHVVAA